MNRWAALCLVGLLALSAGCAGLGTAPAGDAEGPTPAFADGSAERVHTVTVVEVIDGDTVDVRYANGSTERVRLLGVDAPEVSAEPQPSEFEGIPDTRAGREWLREWGHRASEFAREKLDGETVGIVVDRESDVRGSYGRLLAYVSLDGENFNRALLGQGYARMYDSRFSKRATFAETEAEARAEGVGLWGFENGSSATAGSETGLVVAEVHADAEGDDHENLNDEYVVFENAGAEPLELSGWTVRDEAGHTYVFPDGFTLPSGGRVTLYTGEGTDTETELYWHSEGAVWNNGEDTVVVATAGGERVRSASYG